MLTASEPAVSAIPGRVIALVVAGLSGERLSFVRRRAGKCRARDLVPRSCESLARSPAPPSLPLVSNVLLFETHAYACSDTLQTRFATPLTDCEVRPQGRESWSLSDDKGRRPPPPMTDGVDGR